MSKGAANSSCNGEAPCEARLLLLPATMWPRRGVMESAMIAQLEKRKTDDLDIDIKLTALDHQPQQCKRRLTAFVWRLFKP